MEQDILNKIAKKEGYDDWYELTEQNDPNSIHEYTIKALKQALSIPNVVGQSEQLVAFGIWLDKNDKHLENGNITETVQEYLKGN